MLTHQNHGPDSAREASGPSARKEINRNLRNTNFHDRVRRSPPRVLLLRHIQLTPSHTISFGPF